MSGAISAAAATAAAPVAAAAPAKKVSSHYFMTNYYGHKIEHLDAVLKAQRAAGKRIVFLAGDSSLDNKNWILPGREDGGPDAIAYPATNGYQDILEPPRMVGDVSYWLNKLLVGSSPAWACINAAVEEGTIGERTGSGLLDQDAWIRDNMRDGDVLIVSVGGNDIALKPSVSTMASMASVLALGSDAGIEACSALGMGHFVHMFKDGVQDYVGKLVSKATPAFVAVCMIYYPHEAPAGGWADGVLGRLGYNSNPRRLQLMIRSVYAKATCAVTLPRGIPVVPVPLFSILDPSPTSTDYVQRVEPSVGGGKKMAAAFHALMAERVGVTTPGAGAVAAVDAAIVMTTSPAAGGAAATAGDGTAAAGAAPAAAPAAVAAAAAAAAASAETVTSA